MSASDQDRAGDLLIEEVDEELRREQYHQLWKRYGNVVIAAVVAIVVVVAGYQGWQAWQTQLRDHDSARYSAAQALATQGKTAEASEALAKLATDSHTGYGHTGYGIVAQMSRAQLLASSGDTAGALAVYDQIAGSKAAAEYRDLAVLKAALLSLDKGDPAQLEPKVAALTGAGNPWRISAIEVQAAIVRKRGDTQRAIDLYKQLADDPLAPRGVRTRASEILAALPASPAQPSPAKPADKAKG